MSYSYQPHTTSASQLTYTFSFAGTDPGYISVNHISVEVRNSGESEFTTLDVSKWSMSGTNQITLTSAIEAPADGKNNLRIRRTVPKDLPYANFPRGSMLDMLNLDRTFIQTLEAFQEFLDGFLPAGFYFQQNINMNGHKFTNLGAGTQSGDSINWDQWDNHEQRIVALETDLTALASRTIPYYYIATGGETRWVPGTWKFKSAIVFIDGVFQNQNLGAFSITDNGFNFAEPLIKGQQVYALLGSTISAPGDPVNFEDIEYILPIVQDTTLLVPEQYPTLNAALSYLNTRMFNGVNVTISLADGAYNYDTVLLQHPSLEQLTIKGRNDLTASAISGGSLQGGSIGNWQYTFNVVPGHNVVAGDIVAVRGMVGTGGVSMLSGAFRVIASTTNTVTVLMRFYGATFPTLSVTSGNLYRFKVRINFDNKDGIVVRGDSLGMLANVAIVGNMWEYWSASNVAGTEKGTHGIYVGANTIVDGGATPGGKNPNSIAGGSITMRWVAVLDFDQQGICPANASSAFCRYTFASSCGRRGIYIGNSASVDARQCVTSQNYLDGVICDYGGAFNTSGFWSSGNRLDGILANNGGSAIAPNSVCENNQQYGCEARAGSYISFDAGAARFNQSGGLHAEFAASMSCMAADISSNKFDGVQVYYGSSLRGTNANIKDNARYGINSLASSVVCTATNITGNVNAPFFNQESTIQTGSGFAPKNQVANDFETLFQSQSGNHVGKIAQTSAGDIILQADGTNLITFKADAIFSTVDNSKSLGRTGERFTAGYLRQLILGTGTTVVRTGTGTPEGSVSATPGSMYINETGGASATLYIKESGTGNTGWVAK